mgnify:CR=1 FL=1
MVPPAVFGRLDVTVTSHAGGDYRSQQGRHFSGRETVRHIRPYTAVADNTLTIKQKSTLPVSKTRQDKSLFHSLSDTYLPPANPTVCAPRWQREHRAFVRAKARFAGQKAQEHILSVEMLLHRTYCHVSLVAFSGGKCRACLALPDVPASDLPVLIHSRWLLPGPLRHPPPPGVSRFRHFRCYLDPPHPAWLSPASAAARCEPFPLNRLTPAPCD